MTQTMVKRWLQAALAAIVGAAWMCMAAAMVDPAMFNLTEAGLQRLSVIALVGGLGHLGMYLAESPMRDPEQATPAKV